MQAYSVPEWSTPSKRTGSPAAFSRWLPETRKASRAGGGGAGEEGVGPGVEVGVGVGVGAAVEVGVGVGARLGVGSAGVVGAGTDVGVAMGPRCVELGVGWLRYARPLDGELCWLGVAGRAVGATAIGRGTSRRVAATTSATMIASPRMGPSLPLQLTAREGETQRAKGHHSVTDRSRRYLT